MRALTDGQNVDAPSADYPNGRTRDKQGTTAGTLYKENINGDMFQFFQKLIIDAGITPNGLPDNVTNGYQLVDALFFAIKQQSSFTYTNDVEFTANPITTTETTVMSFIPDPDNNHDDLAITFSWEMSHQNPVPSPNSQNCEVKLKVDGNIVGQVDVTTIQNTLQQWNTLPSHTFTGVDYQAGQTVEITMRATGNICGCSKNTVLVQEVKNHNT